MAEFYFSPWRHGGWYVDNVRYPSGAVGCVSRNYPDGKWRIVCDPRPDEIQPTFRTRDDAARAERELILAMASDEPETCSECGAPLDEAGDGYDGLCAECADRADNGEL